MSGHAWRIIVAVAVLSLSVLGPPVQAQDKPSAQELADLRALAEAGDTEAQFTLGEFYTAGEGVPQDDAEAVAWYRLAAQQGHAEAQYNLGVMYDNGEGVPQDDVEARRWYNLADAWSSESTDDLRARIVLAHRAIAERMTPADLSEAQRRSLVDIRALAVAGDAHAQFVLGGMYGDGDEVEAVVWTRKASEQGHNEAQVALGLMYAVGHGVPKDFAVAETWFSLAGERDAEVQFFIGGMYYLGTQEGVQQDYAKAAAWIRLAAEQGDAHAQFVLGGMYEKGEGVPQDDSEAVAWFRKAATQGHNEAQENLWVWYSTGRGVPQDDVEAVAWFSKAGCTGRRLSTGSLGVQNRRGRRRRGAVQPWAEVLHRRRSAAGRC